MAANPFTRFPAFGISSSAKVLLENLRA